ncbi:hypothetical protein COCMIDRAFT_85333 [Bipolaris oryzae ATCC 44560]|uniref:N-acetyltransferase domain-containing protein n=1 Tax=Bipolaris oryzae ATCC 44560 TaxID=930090 RepID=W6ZH21_COCMI|nr:uncharacterized protein COCMIDRAFT_85333 [Bipolaris oryzae ATCC 44560]EUC49198.1 hypothetical protein COCMIDRAFT_85333 [Bipolaris oryzae ATCC 44560]
MGFVVLPALTPDISDVYDVYFETFKNNPVTRALFPSATEADLLNPKSEFRQGHTNHVQEWWKTSQTQYTLKCVDTESNKIVGMAIFDIYMTPSDWRRGEISWLQGKEREQAEALISPLWETREKLWLNEKYMYGHVIAVHPEYQRKGVGEKIFKYGINISENTGLPVYIESSKDGVRFYEKMGCRRLKENLKPSLQSIKSVEGKVLEVDDNLPLFVWLPEGAEKRLPDAVQLA